MSRFMAGSRGCTNLEQEHHSIRTASCISESHDRSQLREIEIRGPPQVGFSKALEYRILPIIWLCYFWDKQLEKVFIHQNLSVKDVTAIQMLEERQEMEPAILAFYIGRAIGVWLASMAMMVEDLSRVIPTSTFLTGVLASLLDFYSGQNNLIRPVCYAFCGLTSSPLMPSAILLTRICYHKLDQPIWALLWATAGPVAVCVGEVNLHVGSNLRNMPIAVEGIFMGGLSLAIEPVMSRMKSDTEPWVLFQRDFMDFDAEVYSNNWTRFRTLWRRYKSQILSSLLDCQLYFFLLFGIADASTKRGMDDLLEWKFADAFAQASPLIAYSIFGAVLQFSTRVGCLVIPMSVATLAEMFGWWPLQNCEKFGYGSDGVEKCRPIPSWLLSLVPAVGEVSITLAIIVLLTNISGKVRSVFLVAVFCSGYAIGGLTRTVLTSRYPIGQWYKVGLIANTIKIVCIWMYVNITAVQNLKRSQQISRAGDESTCALIEGASEETEEMDIKNDHFVYVY